MCINCDTKWTSRGEWFCTPCKEVLPDNEQGEIILIPRADGKIIACGSAIAGGTSGPQTIVPFPTTTFSANDEIFLTIETFPPKVPTQA